MTDPTGLEPITPIKIKATSATERAAFRKCRRQWLLSTVNRLQSPDGNINFWFGDLIHTGLETYYRAQMAGVPHEDRVEPAMKAYEVAYEASLEPLKETLGFLWPMAEDRYYDMGVLGVGMLDTYFAREASDPLFDEVLQVEQRLFIPIKSPAGRKVGTLTVKADAVGRKNGRLRVADHKTATSRIPSAQLDIDDQLSAECFAVWKATGEFPEEVVYNALAKRVPEPPKVLKSGKLSQDKQQWTTFGMYLGAIREAGLDQRDYAEMLDFLATREDPFSWREATFRTPAQLEQFEANLFHEWRDMLAVTKDPAKAYPSPSQFACPSCPVRMVCTAIMDGGDFEELIKREFIVGESRY